MPRILPVALFTIFFSIGILSVAQAVVPASKTFQFINNGSFGWHATEYGATYRFLPDIQTPPFTLCFYNTTPNAYTFGLQMGSNREDTRSNIMRLIWDANRGRPVRDNATLTFGANGNLVLADADGKLVWQTATANKGVVGLELLRNGNLVLVDGRGRFVWQSFDYPTDTLLVGQGLRVGSRLISRVSNVDGSEGPYSMVLEKQHLAMYLKSKNSPKPILYRTPGSDFGLTAIDGAGNRVVVFNTSAIYGTEPGIEEPATYLQTLDYYLENDTGPRQPLLVRTKFNTTLSFIRLDSDGNLRIHSFYDQVVRNAWDVTFNLFNREGRRSVSECKLPARCGSLGVCMNNQCVGCPSPNGLVWWSESCAPPKLPACKKGTPPPVNVNYYKVVGVEHFTSDYTQGDGPVKVSECRVKCSADCGCLGFFYREESSLCYLAYELGTLTKVSNASHVAYIKTSK